MRQYAILKNVARGVNFGVVVQSEGVHKFFGWSEKGIEWSQWANKSGATLEQLPDGIALGEFKPMTDALMRKIIVSSSEAKAAGEIDVQRKMLVFSAGSERYSNASRLPGVIDRPLSVAGKSKSIAIALKIKSLQNEVTRSEIAIGIRFNNLAFNNNVKQFVAKPNSNSQTYMRSAISAKISKGSERRFGAKVVDAINSEIIEKQFGFSYSRKTVGEKTTSIIDYHVKARLGRAIGRAVSSATPNLRGARRAGMRSQRVISGVLDPRKRRDVDGDGMIFDGTWREMPDPSRFTQQPNRYGFDPTIDMDERRQRQRDLIRKPLSTTEFDPSAAIPKPGEFADGRPLYRLNNRPTEEGMRSQRTPAPKNNEVELPSQISGEFPDAQSELDAINSFIESEERAPIGSRSLMLDRYSGNLDYARKRKAQLERMIRNGSPYKQPGKTRPPSGRENPLNLSTPDFSALLNNRRRDGLTPNRTVLRSQRPDRYPSTRKPKKQQAAPVVPPRPNIVQAVLDPNDKTGERFITGDSVRRRSNSDLMNLMSALFLPNNGIEANDQIDGLNAQDARRVKLLRDVAAAEFVKRFQNDSIKDNADQDMLSRISRMEKTLKTLGSAGKDSKGNQLSVWNEILKKPDFDMDILREEGELNRLEFDRKPPIDGTTSMSRTSIRSQRATRPVDVPGSSRRATATVDRAKQPRGLASRRSDDAKPARKSAMSFAELRKVLGKKKVADTDGAAWKSLDADQQETVKDAVAEQKKAIDDKLKKTFKGWWAGQVRGAKKQTARGAKQRALGKGGRYEKRDERDPLTPLDVEDLIGFLDRAVARGDIEKFEVDENKNLVLDENGNAKLSKKYTDAQRLLDDALTVMQMQESDNYEFLEHLHSTRRKALAKKLKERHPSKKVPSILNSSEKSSAAGHAGGEAASKASTDISKAEKPSGKAPLAQRILRMSPEREKRIQLRAERRKRTAGRSGIVLDPQKQMKRRKLRAAAFRRSIASKFRKSKNPEVLSDDLGARRNELHPVQIAQDGTVTLTPEFSKIIGALDVSFRDKSRDLSNDQLLSDLWENLGYSERPVLVTEEEVKSLIEAGWQPIIRGTGNEEVESESYVEQFLTSDGRFIPGRGARAYGVGEYFAYPGGNWTGYSGNAAVDRHSMLVLLPPSATIMTQAQVSKEQRAMQNLTGIVVDAFKTAGGRDVIEKMEAGEIAAEIRRVAPDIDKGETRSAQILSQLVKRLEDIENMPKTDATAREKQEIIDSFDYLARVSKASEVGYFAPIIGVDAIDTNDGSGTQSPMLLHNRSITAAFQRPMTRNEAETMVSGTTKVWQKWTRKPRVVDADGEETPKPKRTRIGRRRSGSSTTQTPGAPDTPETPEAPTPKPQPASAPTPSGQVLNTAGWKQSRPSSTGSNPAVLLTAPDGTQYYAKLPKSGETVQQAKERMETEVLASELYKLAGVPSADLSMGDDNGSPQMLSRMIQARMPNSSADNNAARDGFVVDAWLANWDAPLNDNIKIDSNGNPVRLDVGGSLDFRAQGARKGAGGRGTPFGDTVGEITSLQKSGNVDFTNMDPKEIKRQAQQLSAVTDKDIRALVSKIVSDPQRAAKLAQTLINRRNYIVTNYG